MGNRHNPHGKRFRPLSKDEIEQYEKAARDSNDTLTELTARTLLHTGLQSGEFSHLRGSWLASGDGGDFGILRVPGEEECIGGAGTVGRSSSVDANSSEASAACYTCRNRRDGYWEPKRQAAIRHIPIIEDEVYDLLEDWFETHEQIPLLHNGVSARVKDVAERAGLSRQVNPQNLRNTYGTQLKRMGVDDKAIAALMGQSTVQVVKSHILGEEIAQEFEEKWGDGDDSAPDDK